MGVQLVTQYIMLALMILIIVLLVHVGKEIEWIKVDPCGYCMENTNYQCIYLDVGEYEQEFKFDDTKPKDPELNVSHKN